ncbi:DUF362 domain-containing protein [Propionispora vibrioides]|uniref:DUF362 domain-containing protein n=1 Tax=Propionispora vibrioides TaxID=112903 RepID=A0A1H8S1U0_9FIRM|nr:DUF362 domain-containing protein [Propionispora vibrioides]SEO72496.1 protein of unknown function [Propionispora vibrioides]
MNNISVNINPQVKYCFNAPFNPPEIFPEFEKKSMIDTSNLIYAHVRECIKNLQLDRENFGSDVWNPFGDFIKPGNVVLIKPNLVLHYNGNSENIQAVVTHGSVIRPIVDYTLLALKGLGEIIVGDAPHGNADFDKIVRYNGLKELVEWYQAQGYPVSLYDFRKYVYGSGPSGFVDETYTGIAGDPNGYKLVDLEDKSFLNNISGIERLYGSDYDRGFIVENHMQGHKYLISGSAIKADVIISVPKLKTHKKTGVTINMKNLVGINGNKNYLAHYRIGSSVKGGDEHPFNESIVVNILYWWDRYSRDKLLAPNTLCGRRLFKIFNKPFSLMRKIYCRATGANLIEHGDWYGNDTTWRMCLDLNYILLFCDKTGVLRNKQQKRYFSVVDGIVAGEGDGPMEPLEKHVGYIACGENPFAVDYVCIWQMGFDPNKLKLVSALMRRPELQFDEAKLNVICNDQENIIDYKSVNLKFMPHPAWIGHVER